MGLIVSRLVTGCGKIQQCYESTKLTFNKVNSVRLVETSLSDNVLANTCISEYNLLEYFRNKKCTNLTAELTVNGNKYETIVTDIKCCDKKLRVTLEKNLEIPEVCNKCVSLEVFSCVEDDSQELITKALKANPEVEVSNKTKRLLKL